MGSVEQFVKVRVEAEHLLDFVDAFLAGVRGGEPFELDLGGEPCRFPADVLDRAALDLEYERKPEKTELEITVEWRHDAAT